MQSVLVWALGDGVVPSCSLRLPMNVVDELWRGSAAHQRGMLPMMCRARCTTSSTPCSLMAGSPHSQGETREGLRQDPHTMLAVPAAFTLL